MRRSALRFSGRQVDCRRCKHRKQSAFRVLGRHSRVSPQRPVPTDPATPHSDPRGSPCAAAVCSTFLRCHPSQHNPRVALSQTTRPEGRERTRSTTWLCGSPRPKSLQPNTAEAVRATTRQNRIGGIEPTQPSNRSSPAGSARFCLVRESHEATRRRSKPQCRARYDLLTRRRSTTNAANQTATARRSMPPRTVHSGEASQATPHILAHGLAGPQPPK